MSETQETEDTQYVYRRLNPIGTAYEGASLAYKQGLRGIYEGQQDQIAANELKYLQQRSAHAIRNNGYAKTALNNWKTNASSIKVIWKKKDGKIHTDMQALWDEFTKNPSFDGHGDYSVFQGIANSSLFIGGNSYIRKLIVRNGNSNVVPLKLQLIPYSLHAVNHNNAISSNPEEVIRYGMAFQNSVPTKYFFRKSSLENRIGDVLAASSIVTVPANEIIHTFIREEPSQWLGIPLLAPVLVSLYELDELLDATIAKQKAAQAIALIVEQAAGAINTIAPGSVTTATNSETGKSKIVFKGQGGTVQYLNKGEKVTPFQSADIGAHFSVLIESELRRIAMTLDQAYHELTGDTNGLNFSSLANLAVRSRNRLEYLHNFLFIPLRERPIAEAFKELAVLYRPKVSSAIPYFQLPRWRGVDDLKDAQADLLELQNGLGLYSDKLAERGITMEEVLADRETLAELEKYGIIFSPEQSSPSMNQANNNQANSNSTSV